MPVHRGDARALSQPEGAFDRVLASRLLMVVPEREAVLAEARRVLAPGAFCSSRSRPGSGPVRSNGLRHAAREIGDTARYVEPREEHYFSAAAFRTFIASQHWASVAVWEANGYRYARCRTMTYDDGS